MGAGSLFIASQDHKQENWRHQKRPNLFISCAVDFFGAVDAVFIVFFWWFELHSPLAAKSSLTLRCCAQLIVFGDCPPVIIDFLCWYFLVKNSRPRLKPDL
jgi:hypothetical protein